MDRLPERQSLVAQTVAILRDQLQSGRWERWLPAEWELAGQLNVSRVTLRAALRQLEREKWLRAGQGRPRMILRPASMPAGGRPASRKVLLVSPTAPMLLTSFALYWMEHAREQLAAAGYDLVVHAARDLYRAGPERALARLADRERPAAWILYQSTVAMQRWFSAQELPAVVAGTRHTGTDCPAVDIDQRATSRHMAGRLWARGHRQIALVIPGAGTAGDQLSAEGFQAGAKAAGAQASVLEHDGTVAGVCRGLSALLDRCERPTGLLVARVPHLLTVFTYLGQRQIRIPQQMAVVSRDNDPMLDYLVPSVARYTLDPARFARKVVASLLRRLGGEIPRDVYLLPRFVPGTSLG